MVLKKLIIFFFLILFMMISLNKKEYFSNTFDLKYTRLKIKDEVLKLINKSDNSLYTSFNIKTYESSLGYVKTTTKYILKEKNRKNVLMLGFGLGAIPLRLSLDDKIERIDCVDIDEELFIYFKKLFPYQSKKIKLHLTDADTYLQRCKIKYDIIIDDVFDGYNKIELDYLSLKKCLNKMGKLFMNNYDINNKNVNIVRNNKKIFSKSFNKIIPNIKSQSIYIFNY